MIPNTRRWNREISVFAGAVRPQIPTARAAASDKRVYERYIVGSFQVKISVSTREAMLPAEESTLAILKARLEAMPTTNRWYPVLVRYIGEIGLGGNTNSIPPSLGRYRPGHRPCEENLEEFTGKLTEVIFNCFGGFIGFVLNDRRALSRSS